MEQTADVRGKRNYPLSYTMIPLNYSTELMFEYGLEDANVAAFTEASGVATLLKSSLPTTCGHLARNLVSRSR
jgi:hypothetical protein